MAQGTITKRCGCTYVDEDGTRRQLGKDCPKLKRAGGGWSPTHGTWGYIIGITDATGKRRQRTQFGFDSKQDAVDALDTLKAKAARGVDISVRITVAEYMEIWLKGKAHELKGNTHDHYTRYSVRWGLYIGRVKLDELRVHHLTAAFEDIEERNEEIRRGKIKARVTGPSAMQRMRAMLRSCLSDALREGLVTVNVAKLVKLPSGKPPKALVWTKAREKTWRNAIAKLIEEGRTPKQARREAPTPSSVMVWRADHLGAFLDAVEGDRLYALWHILGTRGLRRGEALALDWPVVDWDNKAVTIDNQLVHSPSGVIEDTPKSDAGDRTVALGTENVSLLKAYRAAQKREQLKWGEAYTKTDRIFTREDGRDIDPNQFTKLFKRLAAAADLPPIRLHDVRHTAGSLMIASGSDPKTVQETLGHADMKLTMEVYVSMFEDVAQTSADNVTAFIPRTRKSV
ncbi:tyrosine-type recombinase/integrase [Nocardia sp. NPDC050713]|uniref:tyrosine-type recombinase/integrase n=1 Tax=Nocardia sp. NPDC050713 TaxID=3154511 RepID=UPI0033D63D7F